MKNVAVFSSNNNDWLLLDTINREFYYEFLRKSNTDHLFVSSLNLINEEQAKEVCCLECEDPKTYRLVINGEILLAENAKNIMHSLVKQIDVLRDFVNPVLFRITNIEKTIEIIKSFKYNNYE